MPNGIQNMEERGSALDENVTGYRQAIQIGMDMIRVQNKAHAIGYQSASDEHRMEAVTVYARAGRIWAFYYWGETRMLKGR